MTQSSIRVAIVEDHWMIRDGLATLAGDADHILVVATGADGEEALAIAAEHRPDVILMDIKMPELDGIEATKRIRATFPDVQVLMLTTFVERELIARALDAGAVGYLTKNIGADELAKAITSASSGLFQMTPDVTERVASMIGVTAGDALDPATQQAIDALTERERDVLRCLTTGASNREIAAMLHMSAGTVKNYVSSILRQLGLTDRTRAAVLAARYNFDTYRDGPIQS